MENTGTSQIAPADFWEDRYAGTDRVWSGRVNQVLAEIAPSLPPGRALDLGCGEGADAIWLAQHGWTVTGIDLSPSAVRRAAEAARANGIAEDRIAFAARDLSALGVAGCYELVTASFLQSPVELPRTQILRSAADGLSSGGHLLITSHASGPPWAPQPDGHRHGFLTPAEEIAALALDPDRWTVRVAKLRPREILDPNGDPATIDDSVVLIQRQ